MKTLANSKFIIITFISIHSFFIFAQNNATQNTNKENKAYLTSKKINESSVKLKENIEKSNEQVKQAAGNIKAVIKIFEPILRLHNKATAPMEETHQADLGNNSSTDAASSSENVEATETKGANQTSFIPEDTRYNSDGTANLGCQHHKEFGCYLDLTSGTVLDEIEVAGNTASVDVIFTATDYYGSAPMYAFLSPSLVKNDIFANYYFRGPNYKDQNIPVRQWEEVNESEIALTNLSIAQFEKINNNNQLAAVIKQTVGFKDRLESRSKMIGKVIAVKTKMGNREANGLIYIVDQYGTTGQNAYLKIKIKVTGFDSNGDGSPDPGLYSGSY